MDTTGAQYNYDVDAREEKISLATVETGTAVDKITEVKSLFAEKVTNFQLMR